MLLSVFVDEDVVCWICLDGVSLDDRVVDVYTTFCVCFAITIRRVIVLISAYLAIGLIHDTLAAFIGMSGLVLKKEKGKEDG